MRARWSAYQPSSDLAFARSHEFGIVGDKLDRRLAWRSICCGTCSAILARKASLGLARTCCLVLTDDLSVGRTWQHRFDLLALAPSCDLLEDTRWRRAHNCGNADRCMCCSFEILPALVCPRQRVQKRSRPRVAFWCPRPWNARHAG